jgi:hypothetical protein
MKKIGVLLMVLCLNGTVAHAFSKKRTVTGPLKTSIRVKEINLTTENALAGSGQTSVSCPVFKGTHAGNEIVFQVDATGGDGDYRHSIVYNVTRAYKLEKEQEGQRRASREENGTISLTLPELEESVPFVQQSVYLLTHDGTGATSTASMMFTVSRPVILMPSKDKASRDKECFERYVAKESTMGVLSNGSTAPSTIQIRQGVSNIWSSSKGWQWGVFVSPLSWLGLGNLVALNLSYFSQTSKQTVETVEVAAGYQLNPGDFMQVYVQPTRYITAYDATKVSACGFSAKQNGAYYFQWWGFAYQVYPVNPFEKKGIPADAVGAPPLNTCSKEFTPLADDANTTAGGYTFRKTNP